MIRAQELCLNATFGRWRVVGGPTMREPATGAPPRAHYTVLCDPALGGCGSSGSVQPGVLLRGKSKMCRRCRIKNTMGSAKKHGGTGTRIYQAYMRMIARCYDEEHHAFHRYGGRGIRVCRRWRGPRGFECFRRDMGQPPDDGRRYTVDRRNNDGDYSPSNCRWATYTQQARNKSNNIRITIDGVTKVASEWAREAEVGYYTIIRRLRRGITGRDLLTKDGR